MRGYPGKGSHPANVKGRSLPQKEVVVSVGTRVTRGKLEPQPFPVQEEL